MGPIQARIDFREEFQITKSDEVAVEKVLFMADEGDQHPDVAVLQFAKGSRLPQPLPLFGGRIAPHQTVAVIGYPANDPRNPGSAISDVFGNVFEVKRLSPGEITSPPRGFLITHDCSTLGGNSGSVVVDVETGQALGLHFGGRFSENNFAVAGSELKKILAKLKVQISVPEVPTKRRSEAEAKPDLSGREGYDDRFLGSDSAVRVPLPKISRARQTDIANVKGTRDNVLRYTHFSIVMNAKRRFAFFTAVNIDGAKSVNVRRRKDRWFLDPRIAASSQAGEELYASNDLDRGHLVRRLDPVWGPNAKTANDDTFFFTNATPQHARLNQGNWNDLEDYVLTNTSAHDLKVSVFTGPVFAADDPEYRRILLPQQFWKVVAVISGETGKLHATAYLLSQKDLLTNIEFVFGQFRTFQLPVAEVEQRTGLSFGRLRDFDPLKDLETFAVREISRLEDIVL
jgi:endonuclease G